MTDWLTSLHAGELASQIQGHWRDTGHPNVFVWAEPVHLKLNKRNIHQVRSNLVNGLPPGNRAGRPIPLDLRSE
jgi:hypothetical protein